MARKTQLKLGLLLPEIPDRSDACVQRLIDLLKAKDGVTDAHVTDVLGESKWQICIHFDADQVSIAEVRELAQRAGMALAERFGHLQLKSKPMHARRARTVEARVRQIAGVLEAAASPAGVLRIEFDRQATDEEAIRTEIQKIGVRNIAEEKKRPPFEAAETGGKPAEKEHDHQHGGILGENTELIFAAICGGLLLIGWLLSWTSISPWIPFGCYLAAYFFGGYFTFLEAFENILARRFEIDFLMLVAAIGAATLGEWFEGALLLFLFSIGHALENYAMGRAKRAIEALAELAPQTAVVRREGNTTEVPVEQLRLGDVVIIKPNERLPADGFVIKGEGSVNQAPITGESVPVDKRAVDDAQKAAANPDRLDPQFRAFAGTINGSGALEIQVTKLASESTLARVVQMVNEAETQKSPTQLFTDKFERWFVPGAIALVVVLLFAWTVIDESFSASFYRAMAVLVAASPCALAISTPSAVLSGIARAARGGVLIKGGGPLENLGTFGAIAFDKTGTLTEGKPRLTDVVSFDGIAEDELLRVAVAVEKLSDHPLAAAVVRDGKKRLEASRESQEPNSDSGLSTLDSRLWTLDYPKLTTCRASRAAALKPPWTVSRFTLAKTACSPKSRVRRYRTRCESLSIS